MAASGGGVDSEPLAEFKSYGSQSITESRPSSPGSYHPTFDSAAFWLLQLMRLSTRLLHH